MTEAHFAAVRGTRSAVHGLEPDFATTAAYLSLVAARERDIKERVMNFGKSILGLVGMAAFGSVAFAAPSASSDAVAGPGLGT